MTEIKRTTIASLLIEQAGEMKGKLPSELGFEDLVDVVQAVMKNCSTLAVVRSASKCYTCDNCGRVRNDNGCIVCGSD